MLYHTTHRTILQGRVLNEAFEQFTHPLPRAARDQAERVVRTIVLSNQSASRRNAAVDQGVELQNSLELGRWKRTPEREAELERLQTLKGVYNARYLRAETLRNADRERPQPPEVRQAVGQVLAFLEERNADGWVR